MLPNNPRMARGLPNNPRPRSRSAGPSREETHSRRSSEQEARSRVSSRQGRPQQPLPRERSRTPTIPASRRPQNRPPDARTEGRSSHKSDDSASSSGSSLLDRMKIGAGYASSRTSLEDDSRAPQFKSHSLQRDAPSKSLRQRKLSEENQPGDEDRGSASGTGDGSAIWSRVATVASSLTVSVSKAWASNITTFAGEETPPGQESRLTRAMKAYHLEKARDPTDLPAWLFDERERRRPVSRGRASRNDFDDDRQEIRKSLDEPPRQRGLRDVYDAAASTTPTAPLRQTARKNFADDPAPPSKATDRLKAMRDAKRGALGVTPRRSSMEETRSEARHDENPKGITPRQRVGLPSGPRRV